MNPSGNSAHSDSIDLGNIARIVKHGWLWVSMLTLLGTAAGVLVWKYAPPTFASTHTLVARVAKERGGLLSQLSGGLGDMSGVLGGGLKGALETESKVMSSRGLVREVVDSLLMQARVRSPRATAPTQVVSSLALHEAFKKVKYTFTRQDAGHYAVEGKDYHDTWTAGGPAHLPVGDVTLTDPAHLPATFVLELRDMEDAVDRVLDHLKIDKPGGEFITVTYRADDSLSAPIVTNTIVRAYLRRRKSTDRNSNQENVAFLSLQIDSISQALTAAARALRRQQEATGVLDPVVVGKLELETGVALREKVTELAVQEGSLRLLVDSVRAGGSVRDLTAFPPFMESGLSSMLSDLAKLETERFALGGEGVRASNPKVLAIDSSIHNIEARLLPQATTFLRAVSFQRRELEAKLDSLMTQVASLPATAETSLRLQGEVLNLSKMYALVQAQLVDARLAARTEGGDIKTLDKAVTPKRPSFPNPLLVIPAGVVGGLLCGVIVALMIGFLGRWDQDPVDVERSTGLPALVFDPRAPLMVTRPDTRTVLVAPLDAHAMAGPVAQRLAQTATSRSLRVTLLDLSTGSTGNDINGMIARLESEHDLVVVQLPGLVSDEAAAALRDNRPVLLVTPERRVDRVRLSGALALLKQMDTPLAGIVMSGGNGRVNGTRPPAASLTAST